MTLQQAYESAIQFKIKDLPNLVLHNGLKVLYISEYNGKIVIRDEHSLDEDSENFVLSTEMLLSNHWDVKINE